ncbi:MAG TPA: DUF2157 domain-containing protein [Anaerohalosphaeraceae bacterium]|nr:DUF2157 domain-containing protein [Anaerohalosphaeraceae bacterium]HPP56789.1 DUF2157 domain-containing protein [Anaerohalosphaeraceae bacterium]
MSVKLPSVWFRKRLKSELPILEAEGLLSAEQAAAVRQRYRLDALASESTGALLTTIYFIGATLVGIGIISFVAAHWTYLSRELKLTLILGVMLAAHISGFLLWKVSGRWPKLGHTLVLLGTLIFGANIGLVAQIFHVQSNFYNGFAAWTLGAVAVAWAVRSVPNAVLGLITAAVFGFGNLDSPLFIWFAPAVLILFVPLVYYLRSQWVLWGTLLVSGFFWPMSVQNAFEDGFSEYRFAAAASLLGLAFFCWGLAGWRSPQGRFVSVPCWIVGLFWSILTVFLASFIQYAQDMATEVIEMNESTGQFPLLILAGVLAAGAVGLAVYSGPVLKNRLSVIFLVLSGAAFAATALLPQTSTFDIVLIAANVIFLLMTGAFFTAVWCWRTVGSFGPQYCWRPGISWPARSSMKPD